MEKRKIILAFAALVFHVQGLFSQNTTFFMGSRGATVVDRFMIGTRYFLDPAFGNDDSDGSSARPWKTLRKAQSETRSGDVVYLRSGNYGQFQERESDRTGFVVFSNEKGAKPVFSSIEIDYKKKPGSAFLVFSGIQVTPDPVAQKPGIDPLDPESTSTTYSKTLNPVTIKNVNDVLVIGCELAGVNKYLTEVGVLLEHSSRIRVESCHLHDVRRGVAYDDSRNLEFVGNHIHRIAASAFKGTDGKSVDILIEGNNAHDSNYDFSDAYCPRGKGANNHGSAVAIRGDRITIRNNIFHDGFNSSGIMTYDRDGPASDIDYSDILIENNIVYDLRNSYVLRFYLLKSNIVVRNNLFVGHRKSSGAQYYDTAVVMHSLATDAVGPVLSFNNNIVVGITNFGEWWGRIRQAKNIFYSCRGGTGPFMDQHSVGGGSVVATNSGTSNFFENGFFKNNIRYDWDTGNKVNPRGHGETLDFTLSESCLAIGFGEPSLQPIDGIGSLDLKGFIVPDPIRRSAVRHNAGPWP